MRYSYKASTTGGKTISGTSEASSKEALISALAKQGAHPIVIKEIGGSEKKTSTPKGFFRPKVKSHDLVIFTRQLSTMVSAGVPLVRSLNTLGEQSENKYFTRVIADISKE